MNSKYISLVLLVIIGAAVIYVMPKNNQNPNPDTEDVVYDFATCAEAGYPVMESEPRTCKGPDGKTYTDDGLENPEVIVETPTQGQLVKSPLTVKGKARGFWFFEANLPVTLKDQNGKVLVQKGFMTAQDWMTTDYVDFEGTLEFATPTTEFGVLLIEKDNPSGLPENDAAFAIPVRFR